MLTQYQAETYFNKEANELIKAIMWTIDLYLNYKTTKARISETKKTIMKQVKKKSNRMNSKKT